MEECDLLHSYCSRCGSLIYRVRRGLLSRVFLVAVYRCSKCRKTTRVFRYWISWRARCPHCGNGDLRTLNRIDRIERLYRNPLSLLQRIFGAPLLYCRWCRLQFYDFRPPDRSEQSHMGERSLRDTA